MFFTPFLLVGLATASPYPNVTRGSWSGIASFNDYSTQAVTVCGPHAGQSGTFGAAASDISPDISGGLCSGSVNDYPCSGQFPQNQASYSGPPCPKSNCGKCYKVTNQGSTNAGSTVGGVGQSVVVQIIDSCPAESAWNFCKTDVTPSQRCGDPGTNQLDIDQSAYVHLTGVDFGDGPNLSISIEDALCTGS